MIMIEKEELCEKIIALYPDIGKCGIDVNVEFDEDQNIGGQKSEIRRQKTEDRLAASTRSFSSVFCHLTSVF
jgi:hypothetical protein